MASVNRGCAQQHSLERRLHPYWPEEPEPASPCQATPPLSSKTLKSLEAVGLSHPGYVRPNNEDSFFLKTRPVADHQWGEQLLQGVFVLCDGMGGCDQGEVASAMATFRLTQDLLLHETPEFTADISLKSSLYKVNQDIHQENIRLRQLGLGKMGTTAVVAVLQERQMSVGHVGDSRCYCLTESKGLEQLTTDHERGQARIAQGVPESEAYASPEAFYLTQALGPMPNHRIVPDVSQIHLDEDSLFLLCSDGLSDYQVLESHGESCLAPFLDSRKDLGEAAQMLLDIGLQHNGHDNITMILVRICLP